MNDKYKKRWIADARIRIDEQSATIEGYSKQITELRNRNQELENYKHEAESLMRQAADMITQLQARIKELESINAKLTANHEARMDELDCDAYNL